MIWTHTERERERDGNWDGMEELKGSSKVR